MKTITSLLFLFSLLFTSLHSEIQEVRPEQALLEEMQKASTKEELIALILKSGSFLKRSGFWQEHIRYGEMAIKIAEEKKRLSDVAQISTQIASTYFYLGDFESCKKRALRAFDIYTDLNKVPGKVASLYLISAANRSQKEYSDALNFGHLALNLYYTNELKDPLLETKILFNLAAVYMDMDNPKLKDAENFLASCLVLINNIPNTPYHVRARLRLVKVYLLQDKIVPAEATLELLQKLVKDKRDQMHHLFLYAQLYQKKREKDQAIKYAKKAKLIAEELNAKADLSRIEALIKSFNKKK